MLGQIFVQLASPAGRLSALNILDLAGGRLELAESRDMLPHSGLISVDGGRDRDLRGHVYHELYLTTNSGVCCRQ